jgi:glycosyltransferase involved in cell wall biosynthesis
MQEAAFVRNVLRACADGLAFEFVVIGRGRTDEIRDFFSPALGECISFTHHPFLRYEQFVATIAQGAIGLAPLCITPDSFNQGKSFGKILAYLGAGVPVIASDAVDHALFFENGKNGFVSNLVEEWSGHIGHLLQDVDSRMRISRNAVTCFRARLSMSEYSRRTLTLIDRAYRHRNGRPLRA